jgi:D-glycero-alpha-D-manno-heptose-7-phosphate kinase
MKIISTAPCRASLFGGGTDVAPFCRQHGSSILNMAINLRHTCEIIPRDDDWVWIEAMGESRIFKLYDIPAIGFDPKFDLIYQTVRSFNIRKGFQLVDRFNGIQGAGLGSSASACVSMIGAFNKWLGLKGEKLEIASRAQQIELSLGWISGYQDQIASVYGGVNYFQGNAFPHEIKNIRFVPEFWEDCFVMVFTGRTRHSDDIQKTLVEGMKKKKETEALMKMKEMVSEGYKHLKEGEVKGLGELLNKSWELKKKSNPAVSNEKIDDLYSFALRHGAIGGKVLGAGGDGHILFVCEELNKQNLIKQLEEYGVKWVDFSISWQGLETREI